MTLGGVLLAAWPWLVFPLVILWRLRHSRSLAEWPAEWPAEPAGGPPPVTIVVPARDERRNIGRCVASLLASTYPALDVVLVDDHSSDGTADVAREAGRGDQRLRVIDAPPLPPGWFGKQWACAAGAAAARGAILCFADADTAHAPDLVGRAVNAMRDRGAGLLSVVGRQELGSFWERVVQPQVLAVLALRYGGTEHVTRSPRVSDKVANGQCLLVTREAYAAAGTHAAVRLAVSEDLALAQRAFAAGHPVALVTGGAQLTTRMYTSLGELVRGWEKNMYAGGREAMPLGWVGQAVYPLLLLFPPVATLLPVALVALAAAGLTSAATATWATVAALALLGYWALGYRKLGLSALYALTYPLGALVLLRIVLGALARGSRVSWKGRTYKVRAGA